MSGERQSSELNEQRVLTELDRELAETLSAMPSSGFEMRVLRQIEQRAAASRRWIRSYVMLAAAAAAVIAIGAAVLLKRPAMDNDIKPATITRAQPQLPDEPRAPSAEPRGLSAEGSDPSAERRAPTTRYRRPGVRAAQEPEVIVPREDAEAVRRYMRGIAEQRFRAPADLAVSQPSETVVVTPLTIDLISILPVEGAAKPTSATRDVE